MKSIKMINGFTTTIRLLLAATFALITLALAPQRAVAATGTWVSTSATGWGTGSAWSGGSAPTFNNALDVFFYAVGASQLANNLGADRTIRTLQFNANADSTVTIYLAGQNSETSANVLTFQRSSTSLPGQIIVDAGAAANHTIGNTIGSITLDTMSQMEIIHNGSGTLAINRPMGEINGAKKVVKSGTGYVTLAAGHSYTGGFQLDAGSVGIASSVNALGDYSGAVTLNGGKLGSSSANGRSLLYNFVIGGNVEFGGTGLGAGALNLGDSGGANTIGLGGATRTLTVSVATTARGVISNGGLTKAGSATLTLSVTANTFSGDTTVSAGTLALNHSLSLQNSALVTTGAGTVTLGVTTPTFGGLSGASGNLATIITSGYTSVTALTLNPNSGTVTYGGVIANGASGMTLTKTGAGTQTLSGANTYSGTTTISAGTLALSGSGSISSSPTINVVGGAFFDVSAVSDGFSLASGQTLKGNGAVVGNLTAASGAIIAAGASVGTLYFSNNVTLNATSTNVFEFTSSPVTNDNWKVYGDLTPNSSIIEVNLSGYSGSLAAGTYRLIDYTGTKIGSFNSTPSFVGGSPVSGTAVIDESTAGQISLVIKESTTTSVSRTTGSASEVYGNEIVYEATVSGSATTPTGNVIFMDGATTLATKALSGGTAKYTNYTTLKVPTSPHSIAGYYQGDSTHNMSDSSGSPVSQTITEHTLNVSATGANRAYDGTTNATVTLGSDKVGGDDVTVAYTSAYFTDSKDIGTGKPVAVEGITMAGADTNNYTLGNTTASTSANVTEAIITVTSGLYVDNKVYSGTTAATVSVTNTPVLAGIIGSEDVTLNTNGYIASFTNANVGISLPVTVANLSLAGADSGNYSLTQPTFTADIMPKDASVTADAQVKTYGAANPPLTATVLGQAIGGDVINYTLSTDAAQFSAVGVSNITVSLGGNPNYTVLATNSTLTITPTATFVGANSTMNPSGYKDAVAFTATLPTDATGSVVFSTTNGPISTNTLSSGSATSLSITNLPRGTNLISVAYLGDGNYLGSTNTLDQVVTNHPPVLAPLNLTRNAGLGLHFPWSQLTNQWNDVDGDAVSLTSFNLTTSNSVTLFTNSTLVGYPSNVPNVADQISYTASDGYGATVSGVIDIAVNAYVTGQLSGEITSFSGGQANLTFHGIPSYSYITERTTNLADWVSISTNAASTNGIINVTDTFNDLGGPPASAYYRLKYQP